MTAKLQVVHGKCFYIFGQMVLSAITSLSFAVRADMSVLWSVLPQSSLKQYNMMMYKEFPDLPFIVGTRVKGK